MSISLYTGQVNRLNDELARLRGKLADERKRLADANARQMKAAQALGKTSTQSQFNSKAREVERYEKAAASHEKRAAELEKQIAAKQKSLSSAESNLDRARRSQQKKDERETEKQRRAELDHIRRIERARRASAAMPEFEIPRDPMPARSSTTSHFDETYDVCLSFAGEQRDYVERIAAALKAADVEVFYDQDEDIAPKLWGRDLGEYLDYIYRVGSRFCLMFISADYAEKAWGRHERRSALARAIEEEGEYVLPARFDDTELPGFRPTIGYVDLREIAPATLIDFVLAKLGKSDRSEDGPEV